MHEWRHCVAWPARVTKVHSSQSSGKDFQNSGPKRSEKYSPLVEDFSVKETAEYQSQWEAFNSAKHARSLPGKKLSKAAWKLCCRKVCRLRGKSTNADEWQRLNTFSCSLQLPTESDNSPNEINVSISVDVLILNASVYSSGLQLSFCDGFSKTLSWFKPGINEVGMKRVYLTRDGLA